MKSIFQNEIKKMLGCKRFWLGIIFGCVISVWQFISLFYGHGIEPEKPANVYMKWLGGNLFLSHSYWYFLFFPIMALIPYAGTFFEEQRDGYFKTILTRTSRKKWFFVKGFVVWLSGGIGVTLPLVLNFLLVACKYPALLPDPFDSLGPDTSYLGVGIYYKHPLIYVIGYLMIDFIVGGVIALSVTLLSQLVEYEFLAIIIPFGLHYLLYVISNYMESNVISPNHYLNPGIGFENWLSFGLLFGYCSIIILIYIWMEFRYEE